MGFWFVGLVWMFVVVLGCLAGLCCRCGCSRLFGWVRLGACVVCSRLFDCVLVNVWCFVFGWQCCCFWCLLSM